MKTLLSIFAIVFIFSGCAQKMNIQSFVPAKIDNISKTKKISVLDFDNDTIAFASSLETKLAQKQVYGKKYFNVISRNELEQILDEQRFQYSGLVDKSTAVKIGNMSSAQTLISGAIADASLNKDYYRSKRLKCLDKKCKRVREYFVRCTKGKYNLSVNIKLIDVEQGNIIFAKNYNKNSSHSYCSDSSYTLPNKGVVFTKFSEEIINEFIAVISPSKRVFSVELLEDPEIDYNDKQEKLLENSLEYLKLNRLNKAEELLSKLLNSTNDTCFVAAYNLGVVKESLGEYKKAKLLYNLAESLVQEPNELISGAVIRIEQSLQNKQSVEEQLSL